MTMQPTDIECELSHAYLHAVASQAGFGCEVHSRTADNAGKDAAVQVLGRLDPASVLTDFSIEVQLKATINKPNPANGHIPYSLPVASYDKLRSPGNQAMHLLVVLFLPREQGEWLEHTPESLILRECAYWVSLRGAEAVNNTSEKTVYIPVEQTLSPDGLREVARKYSIEEEVLYVEPE